MTARIDTPALFQLHQPATGFVRRLGVVGLRLWQGYERHLQRLDLAELDARMLADIGLSETDRRRECRPLWLHRG